MYPNIVREREIVQRVRRRAFFASGFLILGIVWALVLGARACVPFSWITFVDTVGLFFCAGVALGTLHSIR